MGRIKIFHIAACLTLFSTALTVNAFVKEGSVDDPSPTLGSRGPTIVTWPGGNRVGPSDGILLGDYLVTRDGVVLGDRSIFSSGILLSDEMVRGRSHTFIDGVVLGDRVSLETGFVSPRNFKRSR